MTPRAASSNEVAETVECRWYEHTADASRYDRVLGH